MLGKVGTQGSDHHVGTADGLGDEVEVEDVRMDQDLNQAAGRGRWLGPVDGPDRVRALGSKVDELLADGPGGSKDGDVHSDVRGDPIPLTESRGNRCSFQLVEIRKHVHDIQAGAERGWCENQIKA